MGKKASNKTVAAKANAAAPKARTAAGKILAEEESSFRPGDWARSAINERDINDLKNQGLLEGMEHQLPGDEEIPNPPEGWRVIFLS